MHKFETLDELFDAAENQKICFQDIIDNRAKVFGSWQDIETSQELKLAAYKMIVKIIGGRNKTKEQMLYKLQWGGRFQHWGLMRFFLCKYSDDKEAKFVYCCGQHWQSEMQSIRKFLKS